MLGIIGFFIIPILPVGYSFCVEIAHPVGEAQALGVMITFAQLLSTGMGTLIAIMLDDTEKDPLKMESLFIITGLAVGGFFFSLLIRGKL